MTKKEILNKINQTIAENKVRKWHIRKITGTGGKDLDNILSDKTECSVKTLLKITDCLNLKIDIK